MGSYPIEFRQGDVFRRQILWRTPTLDSNGNPVRDSNNQIVYVPVDNTGFTALFTLSKKATGSAALTLSESGGPDGGVSLGGSNGLVVVTIASAATTGISTGQWLYLLRLTSPSGDPKDLLSGFCTVRGAL